MSEPAMKAVPLLMARATDADMEAAILINAMLSDAEEGQFPRCTNTKFSDQDPDHFEESDEHHCTTLVQRILSVMRKNPGAMNRVVWGMSTVIHNRVFDPMKDTLQWHPDLLPAIAARKTEGGAS